jgi:hypothetical protein
MTDYNALVMLMPSCYRLQGSFGRHSHVVFGIEKSGPDMHIQTPQYKQTPGLEPQ